MGRAAVAANRVGRRRVEISAMASSAVMAVSEWFASRMAPNRKEGAARLVTASSSADLSVTESDSTAQLTDSPTSSCANVDELPETSTGGKLVDDPKLLLCPARGSAGLTVVVDLDETLVYAREGPVWLRPYASQFLSRIKAAGCDVIAWTAGEYGHVAKVLDTLDHDGSLIPHCVYRGEAWLSDPMNYHKDLHLLGRCLDRVLLVENSLECIRHHTGNAILVDDYRNGIFGRPSGCDFTAHAGRDHRVSC
eukprot:NODE_514_length_1404_cov_300.022140_g391_i0.p1 GENE.NODE_514_length_1404_cov_300.022140_g391_i0~~NODE_514_length_1404_cov_300.022140_g391_i0.p1  ORF type:complete len:259 (-),score=15.49 NODE_514_length_1404_cov_300.022140_g391_i0:628-1380(-)